MVVRSTLVELLAEPGQLIGVGLLLFSLSPVDGNYWLNVMPPMILPSGSTRRMPARAC